MSTLKEVLEKIKNLRNQKGISQAQMAKMVGVTQAGYANIETNDKGKLSLVVAVGIAKALNVGFNELFDIDGDSQKIDSLNNEIKLLEKRIIELEDQLNDKRSIIEFLSSNDLLWHAAMGIDYESGEYDKRRANTPKEAYTTLEGFPEMPYDRENKESLINYISTHAKTWRNSRNK